MNHVVFFSLVSFVFSSHYHFVAVYNAIFRCFFKEKCSELGFCKQQLDSCLTIQFDAGVLVVLMSIYDDFVITTASLEPNLIIYRK